MAKKNEIVTLAPQGWIVRDIRSCIFTIRGMQVMLDKDLAAFYGVSTSRLNEQVKRNIKRFPERYRFQLTQTELDELIANCDRLRTMKHVPSLPFAFTEQGVSQLSSVLKSDRAVEVSILIIDAFVAMRRFIAQNAGVFQRIDQIEKHLILTDSKVDETNLRIDIDNEVFHFGASIKDLGKKWFEVSKITEYTADELLERISKTI